MLQQIYSSGLWLWGSTLQRLTQQGVSPSTELFSKPAFLLSIGSIMAVLLWSIGLMLLVGLPEYYRQSPGHIPSFIPSIFRRKIVLWFLATIVSSSFSPHPHLNGTTHSTGQAIQTFFLSAPYSRTWLYLYSSQHLKLWQTILLIVLFFVLLWVAILTLFYHLTKTHPWLLPIFAMGLGAPRWAQVLWATSGIAAYIPWAAGGAIGSAIAGRVLWLWLGMLDTLQGVGFGVILLQTLTRFHICFTLICGQVVGAAATILGRAVAPDKLGPGSVFPNFGIVGAAGLRSGWFWGVLLAQLVVVNGGAFKFFRKEQLAKP